MADRRDSDSESMYGQEIEEREGEARQLKLRSDLVMARWEMTDAQRTVSAVYRTLMKNRERLATPDDVALDAALDGLRIAREQLSTSWRQVVEAWGGEVQADWKKDTLACQDWWHSTIAARERSYPRLINQARASGPLAGTEQKEGAVGGPLCELASDDCSGSPSTTIVPQEDEAARTAAEEPKEVDGAAPGRSVEVDVAVPKPALECRLGIGQFRPPMVPAAEGIRADRCFCCCLFRIQPMVHSTEDCPYFPFFPLAERAWLAAATARCYKCLRNGHQSKFCPAPPPGCELCGEHGHHTLVHHAPTPYFFSPQFRKRVLKDWRVVDSL